MLSKTLWSPLLPTVGYITKKIMPTLILEMLDQDMLLPPRRWVRTRTMPKETQHGAFAEEISSFTKSILKQACSPGFTCLKEILEEPTL